MTPFGALSSSHLHPSHSSSVPQRGLWIKHKKAETGRPATVLVTSILGLSFPISIAGVITFIYFFNQTCGECLLSARHCYKHFININSFNPSSNPM